MLVQIEKLQKIVSLAGTAPSFLRDYFFGVPAYYPNGEINIEITKNGQQVAPFVAPEIGGKVMERLGSTMKTFTAPEVAPQRVITTKNLLAAAGNSEVVFIEVGSTPESRQAKLIKDDFKDMEDAITRREESMCAEALFKGQVTVTGDGYGTQVIKFWDDADKPYSELTGTALWTATATADPLTDIEFGISQTQNRSGITSGDVIMSPKTWTLARNSDKLLKQLDTKNLDVGEIFGQNKANEMGVRLVARLNGVNIWTYSKTLKIQGADGTVSDVQIVPDGLVLFGSQSVPTEMAYGVVSITDVKNQKLVHSTGRRVVNQYLSQKNPAGIVNETKCAPLPIPKVPDGFYVLKVTA